jgi:tRNA (guanosine-2'-O-)-methyltransferase
VGIEGGEGVDGGADLVHLALGHGAVPSDNRRQTKQVPQSGNPPIGRRGFFDKVPKVKGIAPEKLVLSARQQRVRQVVAQRTRSLVVVLEDLEDPHNIAAVLRTCESLGVQEVHAITRRYSFHPNPKITQGAEKWLDLHLHRDTSRCLSDLKARGYLLCCTDLGEGSKSLFELPTERKLAVVFGTEKIGVSAEAMVACPVRFKIPMVGFSQSLNISVAAAVCLSHLIFKKMEKSGGFGDLPDSERAVLEERFLALSVKQRHRIFKDVEDPWNRDLMRASKRHED